jgi:hypothetical protein
MDKSNIFESFTNDLTKSIYDIDESYRNRFSKKRKINELINQPTIIIEYNSDEDYQNELLIDDYLRERAKKRPCKKYGLRK